MSDWSRSGSRGYGPTTLAGSARAHLGDVLGNVNNEYSIQHAQFNFNGAAGRAELILSDVQEQCPQVRSSGLHSAMRNFETNSDDTFEKAHKRVKRSRNNPRRMAADESVSYNKHFEAPHLLSPVFTGRDEDLQHLTKSFAAGPRSQDAFQRRFVLYGLGGSDKTQICLNYLQANRERYWGIFWVDTTSHDRIQQCFGQIAHLLQVDENVDSVKRRLANISHPWLLVFDNADDPKLGLAPYFPAGNRGDVIITSRNPQCQHYNTVGYREVGRLSHDDSMSLLTKTIYGMPISSQDTTEDTTEARQNIVEGLGCLALAIVQAGSYIRETSCSLHNYLEIYERRKRSVLRYLPTHLGTDYQHSVYTTWQVSVDMIAANQGTVSHHALQLLCLLGFYHHEQIPVQMFHNAWHQSQTNQVPDYLPWHDTISDFFDYRQSVSASITLLASFSLVTRNTDASLSFHPLVHEWCRERMSREEQQSSYRRALSLLASSVNWGFKSEDYTFRRSLVAHVHEILRPGHQRGELSDEDKMHKWPTLALILGENGWTRDAIELIELVLKLHKSKLGEDHLDTLRSMHSLSIQYSEAGRWTEALQLMEEVLGRRKNKLGEDHPGTLGSMDDLAIRYSKAGRLSEALQLAEEVTKLRKSNFGEDHLDTLQSMHNLAIRYGEAGRWREALQLTEEVLRRRKKKLGEDHPDTLSSMNNLAIWYNEVGRRVEAQQLAEEVVKLRKSKLGDDHPNTLASMHNLANQYSHAGRRTEALQLTEEVVKLRRSKLGEGHPSTLASMDDLAIRYSKAGRPSEALYLAEEVAKLRKSNLGEDHPDMLRSMHNLANRYSEAGRRTEALQLTEEVLGRRKNKLGEDHPDTLSSMHRLAIRYCEVGRRAEALQLMEEVVKLLKSKLGDDHPNTLASMHNLANQYSHAKRWTEAIQLKEEVVELYRSKFGKDHPSTVASMNNLAIWYSKAGRLSEAYN